MKKVYVTVTTRLIIRANEGVNIEEDVLSNMDYHFDSQTDGADIEDTEITGWEITDSR